MSLSSLIRNAALGIALTFSCAPSENKFDRSFDHAQERLEQQGIEVRGGLWNDEEGFTRLVEYMRQDLDDLDSRRYGSGSCDEVGLSSYLESTFYCGPGAVQGNCNRVNPGDCLNQICYAHDGCYDDLLDEKNQLCIWSDQTRDCDGPFFQEYGRCTENDDCGFYCQLIGAIAANLTAIEYGYDVIGPGCLWGGDYDQPQIREEPEDKENKDDPDLIGLCVDWHQRNYLDCLNPPQFDFYEQLIERDCNKDNLESITKNRSRLECAYEKDCALFQNCLDKNPI